MQLSALAQTRNFKKKINRLRSTFVTVQASEWTVPSPPNYSRPVEERTVTDMSSSVASEMHICNTSLDFTLLFLSHTHTHTHTHTQYNDRQTESITTRAGKEKLGAAWKERAVR